MTSRRIVPVAAAVLLALAFARAATLLAQTPRRSMYVSMLDAAGAPVPDLGPSDFIVREDSVKREVLTAERATQPIQAALLVDNTTSARSSVRDIRQAVTEFVTAMTAPDQPKNQVAIIGFAERPTILADYTSDRAKLDKGIGRIFTQSMSGSYLLDAIIETSDGFAKREAARPVIVVLTTEGPELSNRYHDQVINAVHRAGAALHIVVLGPPAGNIGTTEAQERAVVFETGSQTSGGRYDNVLASSALPGRLKQVADELTHQYLVTYARPESLIPPEQITVSAARPGLVARGTPITPDRDQGRR
jgi:VWFA-related protein